MDVGANIGYFTLLFAYCCMPGGKCLSIEPDPNLYDRLRWNVEVNRLTYIVTAVSAADFQRATGRNFGLGRVVPTGAIPSGCEVLKVESITLDEYRPNRIGSD